MSKIASEVLIERLADWGVDTIFGLPGDGINGIMEGLRRDQDRVRFVLVHHEEAAAFMATGYAKSTGRLGVCLATSGPGAIHLLNGLYDAKLDHAPVLAITGMQETQMLGTGYQQEVALEKLFIDVAEYNEMIHVPIQVPTLVDLAIRHALARRGVAHLTIPTDIQIADAGANPWERRRAGRDQADRPDLSSLPGLPRQEDISRRRQSVLNAGVQGGHARRGRSAEARERRSCGRPNVWAAQSSRRCRARRSFPTTTHSPSGGSDCWAPPRLSTPWRTATPCSWSGRTSRTPSTCPSRGSARWCRSRPTHPCGQSHRHRGADDR